ncbi:MAG: GTPase ObgE [Oscillospiraceae bacterium]|jgi:GTP-binding protein|nr:GTPase ObgE [Oscillospiraceae bacterium]
MAYITFFDTAKIKVSAGNGGDGAVSFHREKYIAAGGPDGGDGGVGGNVIFKADTNLSTLSDFRYKRKYTAEHGENGRARRQFGKSGKDLVISVPKGTVIKEAETGRVIADISDEQPKTIAKGGRGGWGNSHFATPTRQAPRFAKPGTPGESFELQLELKLLADVGLVGFPNVGKSSLIAAVSEAKPEIRDYHFTTISPVLGVIRRGEGNSFVMADIPGLIEGASEGAGLGHEFLRHVDRCRMLVHVVDVSGSEGRNPIEDFNAVNRELKNYNPELADRPMIVAGNKTDLASEEQLAEFEEFIKGLGYAYFPMMAAIAVGVDPMLDKISEMLQNLPPISKYEEEAAPAPDESSFNSQKFTVSENDGVYFVEGEWLLRLMRTIDFSDYESLQYFERVLTSSGVIDALVQAGIKEKDTVSIYDFEFDFVF